MSGQAFFKVTFSWLIFVLMGPALADTSLNLEVGLQQSFYTDQPVKRVAVGDPTIADVAVINENELLITPHQAGVTNLTVWPKNNSGKQTVELMVTVAKQLKQYGLDKLEDPNLQLNEVGDQLQLQGDISSLDSHATARSVLSFDTESGIDSTIFDQGSQVQIDIKIVELSKNRLQSAGFFFGKGNRTTRSISAPGAPSTLSRNASGGLSLLGDNFNLGNDAFNLIYGDLSPEFRAMTLMRFPINYGSWRSQNEKTLQRRTNHPGHKKTRSWCQGGRHLPRNGHIQWHLLQLA